MALKDVFFWGGLILCGGWSLEGGFLPLVTGGPQRGTQQSWPSLTLWQLGNEPSSSSVLKGEEESGWNIMASTAGVILIGGGGMASSLSVPFFSSLL